jgi:hypothetical protein
MGPKPRPNNGVPDPNRNKRSRGETGTKLDFLIKIQYDSYITKVTALPPSFDWNENENLVLDTVHFYSKN